MAVGHELTVKGVYPVAGGTQKTMFVALVFGVHSPSIRRHVRGLKGRVIVEQSWVIAAVVIFIGLDVKAVGEHPAAVADTT